MVNNIKREKKKRSAKKWAIILACVLTFAVSFGLDLYSYFSYKDAAIGTDQQSQELSYPAFLQQLESGNVEKVALSDTSPTVEVYLTGSEKPLITCNPGTETFKETLLLHGVSVEDTTYKVSNKKQSGPYYLLSSAFFSLIESAMIGLLVLMGFSSVSMLQGPEKASKENARKVSFDSIVGLDEIKKELLFLVSLMKNEDETKGVRIPKGILLEGPPGNGKTMLARAIATEADVNFLAVSASDLTSKFIGETGHSVRKLFEKAKQNAPCIIFFDEIDAIGTTRVSDASNACDKEMNAILNTLLTKLDGIGETAGVTVLAATNMAASLDPALVRPGRFDKRFYIGNPDGQARQSLFAMALGEKNQNRFDFAMLSTMTQGCSCCEIENIVNEAKLLALKTGAGEPDEGCILKAIKQFQLKGLPKEGNRVSDRERQTVSVHEAGHAIVAHFFAHRAVTEVTVCPTTSGAGGFTQTQGAAQEELIYADEVFGSIAMLLGGKAAEYVIAGSEDKISFGADSDIDRATGLAIRYIKFRNGIDYTRFGEAGVTAMMQEAREILRLAYEKAVDTVRENREKLMLVAEQLQQHSTITADGFLQLMALPEGE